MLKDARTFLAIALVLWAVVITFAVIESRRRNSLRREDNTKEVSLVKEEIKEQEAQIPNDILIMLIDRESKWDKNAVGAAGERGLMQIMPSTAKDMGAEPGWETDPVKNIQTGCKYLRWLQERPVIAAIEDYDKRWRFTLIAYNWGIGNVTNVLNGNKALSSIPDSSLRYANDILGFDRFDPAPKWTSLEGF